ncbi:tight adherence protein B [Primorskyibacter sedentarius]|uniref:Tight adherence protein B n=1 Tax=Primorskyibacter sedentarius TaxID=745311 RepID=A0A4R3JC76_9RHOB|nr:type II secretion system F family protein [Primorskyibacter sedentarius]TCS62736.1 tight adherence protein B [Primorskyibacter sedentarius]
MAPNVDLFLLIVAGLAASSVAGGLFAVTLPLFSVHRALARRIDAISREIVIDTGAAGDGRSAEHRSIKETLREVEEVRRARNRRVLIRRLREAGLNWSKPRYYLLSTLLGLMGAAIGILLNDGLVVPVGFAAGFGVGLPSLMLSIRKTRRIKAASAEFPTAIDIVVRGVKSGLPLRDCLHIIANETRDPLRSEFQKILNDLNVGLPMGTAIQRFAERVPLTEANFLAIVITIQSRTGGSLAESLDNLSNVLRERNKMRGKIRAMSSEAKASGAIIGALPILVAGIMTVTSPDYISVLYTETTGNMILAASGLWMGTGILVMRKMIAFDF